MGNPSAQKAEAGGSSIQCKPELPREILSPKPKRKRQNERRKRRNVSMLVLYKLLNMTQKKSYRLLGTQRTQPLSHVLTLCPAAS